MNYVLAAPEMMAAAATNLGNIGSTISAANAAAAAPTSAVLAAGADQVSVGVATMFGAYTQAYQAISAQAAAFHEQFVEHLNAGAVAYGNADLTRPIAGYQEQSQIAVGGLFGYDFGPLTLQSYLTTDVVEHNYGGWATRGWFRMNIPLWTPSALPQITKGGS